ncbi:diacylglycerol kinase family protein [Ruminococcaceae bacterium OttesenSCG-928-A16]|nr:diacylglycerol kinase family protein [Ruminococcaceae bacterium OttesenSCG-928-A16]
MRSFLRGFVYAANGIRVAIKEERNIRFHLCAAAYVYLFSLFYPFGTVEYTLLTLLIAAVIGTEMVNSAIERAVGPPVRGNNNKYTAHAKDMAAGAVLVWAVAAVVCAVFLFWQPAVFHNIYLFFYARPWLLVLLVLSFAGSYWFVFHFGKNKE